MPGRARRVGEATSETEDHGMGSKHGVTETDHLGQSRVSGYDSIQQSAPFHLRVSESPG